MSERKKRLIFRISAFIVSACIVVAAPLIMFSKDKKAAAEGELTVLNVWQIDNFEGGRGSRAAYLQNIGNTFSKNGGCYVTVTAISAAAAIENFNRGTVPDLISYGAGMSGLERYISGTAPFYCWCNGGYCLLSLEQNDDFSKVTAENTVINAGTGNRVTACALFIGLSGADVAQPTAAYVKLINGLYQNISITAKNGKKRVVAQKFIEELFLKEESISKLGLFKEGQTFYEDELHALEGLNYELTLKMPLSENVKTELDNAILNSDLNLIKNLLK